MAASNTANTQLEQFTRLAKTNPTGFVTYAQARDIWAEIVANENAESNPTNPTFETITVTGLSTLNTVNASGAANFETTLGVTGQLDLGADIVFTANANHTIKIADSTGATTLNILGSAGTLTDGGDVNIQPGVGDNDDGVLNLATTAGLEVNIARVGVIPIFADSIQTAAPSGGSAAPFRIGSYDSETTVAANNSASIQIQIGSDSILGGVVTAV